MPASASSENMLNRPDRAAQRDVVAVMRQVSMCFGDPDWIRALTEISLEVWQGEVFGLLGPKGSGKSTTLRILAGRLRPTAGKVKVLGRSPWRAAVRACIGYLPEKASHDRPLGLASWLWFFKERIAPTKSGRSQEGGEAEQKARRRQSLARVIRGSRDLVLLDCPFSGLDPAGCRELKEWILTLATRGKTVVLSSDSLAEAKDVCSRVAILHDGKIEAMGALTELLATPDAMRFIGPVLPRPTAERLMKVVRDELRRDETLSQKAAVEFENVPPTATQAASLDAAPPDATAVDQVLAPLTKTVEPSSSSRSVHAADDPANHQKLAELTKQTSGIPSPPDAKDPSSTDGVRADQKLAALSRQPK